MFDFIVRKIAVKNAQRFIDRLEPKVGIHIPRDLPIPAIGSVKRMSAVVSKINGLEPKMSQMSDHELKEKTQEFKIRYEQSIQEKRKELEELQSQLKKAVSLADREELSLALAKGKEEFKKTRKAALNAILPEVFAVVREVGKRVLSMRHFDVQLVGGIVLHEGNIAEMATGEGKTLVATLPAYLNALTGEGVHIVTVNDYLARRDREWMGPIYEFLGLRVGVILHDMDPQERQEAYHCDITYGTNNEFGFDYLRDNMVDTKKRMTQRGHHFAIVDEVDSILIDEARVPLIISGPAEESTDKYYTANEIVKRLKGRRTTEQEEVDAKYRNEDLSIGYDYLANEKNRSIALTEEGEIKAARQFGVDNLHDMDTIEYRHHVLQALRAKEFFKRDVDYVMRDGQVIIVDEFTGRLMPGRRWSDGLHQAVEAREAIKIERENQTLATITFQNYFRMYDKLSGMTGTAYTEANEFKQIYLLDCVVIPPNRILRRTNHTDCIYKSVKEKFNAVVSEIEDYYNRGQPVLVGTISIEKSEYLSLALRQKGIPHQVLNAKYHEREAQIIAQAGRHKAVTIATNMAGRGTDILLGGNAEVLTKNLADQKLKDMENKEERAASMKKFLEQFQQQVQKEHELVVSIGGLHVLGTERHESRRIDNQLRGRSGRQGDPGSSRFYVALEDDLMRLFGQGIMNMWNKLGVEEGQVIEHPWVAGALERAQKRVENYNFEIRKQLLEFDNVMNKQREAIYGLRRMILESEDIKDRVIEAMEEIVNLILNQYLFSGQQEGNWDIDGLEVYLKSKFNFDIAPLKEQIRNMNQDEIYDLILGGLLKVYEHREQDFPKEELREIEKFLLLNIIDAKWKDHLYAMDQLKEGVGLRSYGQRDPLVEYKREGFMMFQMMYESINQELVETIFRVRPVVRGNWPKGVFSSLPQNLIHQDITSFSAGPEEGASSLESDAIKEPPLSPKPYQKSQPKVGRNDPCPCGSGKKYKKCCGRA